MAAAFSKAGPMGIDVEQISCWNRGMEDIAFVAGEKFLLEKSPHRSSDATRLWVRNALSPSDPSARCKPDLYLDHILPVKDRVGAIV